MKLIVEESEFIYCDMQDVLRYLRQRNPATALRFVQAFKATVAQLAAMPGLGRPRADLAMPEVRSWRVGSVIGVARAEEASFCFKPLSGTGQARRASGQPWALGSLAAWHRLPQRKVGGALPEMIRIIGVDD